MPHVIRYNATNANQTGTLAKYSYFRADEDYAEIARYYWLKGNTTAELVEAYANAVTELAESVGIQMSLKANGVTKADFKQHVMS